MSVTSAPVAFAPGNQPLVGRGVLTAPPMVCVVRMADGGLGTARPTTDRCMERSGPRTAQPYHALVGTRCRASVTSFPPATCIYRCLALLALLLCLPPAARAQWLTQNITLQPGWNAVYLHVDASHASLDSQVGGVGSNPISEVWLWQPQISTAQFVESPAQPTAPNSQWAVWNKDPLVADTLTTLIGNNAYLVRNTNTVPYVWAVKGKPVPANYQWATSGLNFIGFATPETTAPFFDAFLAPVPALLNTAEIYRYPGGDLGAANPARVFSAVFRSTPVTRGHGFWVRAGTSYNRYFGPFEVALQNNSGVQFYDNLGTSSIRLKNTTAASQTVTLRLLASEDPPVTQPVQTAITAPPPLLVRGALNLSNLTYAHSALNTGTPATFTLAPLGQPGSELEVVLGLNRSVMPGSPGALYAGVLRFTDAGNLAQQDIPVTATVAATTGLWVGGASIDQVGQYLKTYAKATNAADFQSQLAALNASVSPPWRTNESVRNWRAVAASGDGRTLAAVDAGPPDNSGGYIYLSKDSGATWTPQNIGAFMKLVWRNVAVSQDGLTVVAVPDNITVAGTPAKITLTRDGGLNWARTDNPNAWSAVASSADGTNLIAAVNGGGIYTSVNRGTNWTLRTAAGARAWSAVASSTNGVRLVAAVNGGGIYTSADAGANWTLQTGVGTSLAWSGVASSVDGSRLAAVVNGGGIFTSADFGETWIPRPAAGTSPWSSVTSSGDGSQLAATVAGGKVFVSADYGQTWGPRDFNRNWAAIASSSSGSNLVAVATGANIYTSVPLAGSFSFDANSNLIIGTNGISYVVSSLNTSPGVVPRPVPLRLILHSSPTATVLLQRVYYGLQGPGNLVVATRESVLNPATLASARRISAVHLPFSHTNAFWPSTSGQFGNNLAFNVALDYKDQASNPFLHTYHPDHDNLFFDKTANKYKFWEQGVESYGVSRKITLVFTPPAADFASLTAATTTLGGVYTEVMNLVGKNGDTKEFTFSGPFTLNRISPIATLTTP